MFSNRYVLLGNFLIIEINNEEVKPEAICYIFAKSKILVRQGSYHTKKFGDKFIKVSLSVPKKWTDEFITLFPSVVKNARGINVTNNLY